MHHLVPLAIHVVLEPHRHEREGEAAAQRRTAGSALFGLLQSEHQQLLKHAGDRLLLRAA